MGVMLYENTAKTTFLKTQTSSKLWCQTEVTDQIGQHESLA